MLVQRSGLKYICVLLLLLLLVTVSVVLQRANETLCPSLTVLAGELTTVLLLFGMFWVQVGLGHVCTLAIYPDVRTSWVRSPNYIPFVCP